MSAEVETERTENAYDFRAQEAKWRPYWEKTGVYKPTGNAPKGRRYVLDMFPYPSGDLHMGHAEAFAIGDMNARYYKQCGYDVLHPIGWDSFGLPAENAAIKNGTHPKEWTYKNIDTQAESFKRYAIAVDWDRRLHTSDPEYYKWTQWLFEQFYKKGLAYRKDSMVNWCPKDQTVLANEQVVNGACERCGTTVTKKSLNQWYFKITDYAQQLLDDMEQLEGKWPERVLLMQRNWIGRSEGAEVRFEIEATEAQPAESFTVFTTRPDTLYGSTFIVVAADSAFAEQIVAPDQAQALEDYREQIKALSDIDRQSSEREKTGMFTGRYAINPLNGAKLPVWASDYVLADYGTGAIMAVPAHDQRDLDFAKKFDLPIVTVLDVEGAEDPAESGIATAGDGVLINSGELTGLPKAEAIAKATELVEAAGTGEGKVIYRLRDWLLSRQRFWGTPIPVIHCEDCGEVLVPEEQLPVLLPDNLRGEQLAPKGQSPLAAADDWAVVPCPQCGKSARRDSDTMDTFVDSSWYFLRYVSPRYADGPFDPQAIREWGAVDMYVGGVEHAILHLLYARFFTKVIRDLGLIEHGEPFKALMNQGQVLNGGKAMSKSLGNGVNLGEQLDQFGVDAVRTTMIFASPPEDDVDWADVSPAGSQKFLARAWRVAQDVTSEPGVDAASGDANLHKLVARTVHDVKQLLDAGKFNVVVAKTMELVNATRKAIDSGAGGADPAVREAAETIAILLSLYAPYTAEDMWHALGHDNPVLTAGFPQVDDSLLVDDTVTAIVQIKGKVKARLEVSKDISEAELEKQALKDETIAKLVEGSEIRKVIVRAPKLVNIVI
ncbi:MAG: leucine--tRNA ligase [Rothia sp. (in: high G+C Gram-positive bacteria)]|uniref:leucine--tRNA ligase n=1 Tax=Rothia sp. (in: high G+C Gram-positive bacteria) TaxID=1885016 RepID=UPI0026DCED61|nr:leucine--tRNA ligase [Rothia sp. (in: high G+C Gram-positive bacteria)]MDO4884187.1 leucine--tRNA ligase [Rothia sp. (in: high G+C Gram-positive bacteria)]